MYHETGTQLALRGIYRHRVWHVTSATLVEDSPDHAVLLVVPGCQRFVPQGLQLRKKGDFSHGRRWDEMQREDWVLVPEPWQWGRVLWILEPDAWYSIGLFWEAATGDFSNYYVNFQLPFVRSHAGFDTLDLDLDIVVSPSFQWEWKDVDEWEAAKESGALSAHAIEGVEDAKAEALGRIADDLAHLRPWLGWEPPPDWQPASLPEGWDSVE